MDYILNLAYVFDQKQVTRQGNVIVSLGEDRRAKWNETLICETGSIVYRKGYHMQLLSDNHFR